LSISLTALLTFLESLSWEGIMDDIDLTRDTERETAVNINLKDSAAGKKEIFLKTNILPCNVMKRKHRLRGGAAQSGHM